MIIEALLNLVHSFVALILSPIDFPSLPAGLADVLQNAWFAQAMGSGIALLAAYTHFEFISGLFLTVAFIHVLEVVYKWCCWILRKIPFLNVRG